MEEPEELEDEPEEESEELLDEEDERVELERLVGRLFLARLGVFSTGSVSAPLAWPNNMDSNKGAKKIYAITFCTLFVCQFTFGTFPFALGKHFCIFFLQIQARYMVPFIAEIAAYHPRPFRFTT